MRRLILAGRIFSTTGGAAARAAARPSGIKAAARRLGLRAGVVLLVAGLVTGLALWSWQSGALARQADAAERALESLAADAGLAVREVYVRGRTLTDPADLRAAVGVQRGTPILSVAPQAARTRIEALPWVSKATVERNLPHLLNVTVRERRPLALWQVRGRVQVIDSDGQPVHGAAPARFKNLPLVVGAGAPAHTRQILDILRSEPVLAKRVQAAVRVSRRRWNVRLGNGVDVKLPDRNARSAWEKLARLERRHGLLQRDIEAVDLRLPDQFMVRLAPGAAPYEVSGGLGEAT